MLRLSSHVHLKKEQFIYFRLRLLYILPLVAGLEETLQAFHVPLRHFRQRSKMQSLHRCLCRFLMPATFPQAEHRQTRTYATQLALRNGSAMQHTASLQLHLARAAFFSKRQRELDAETSLALN